MKWALLFIILITGTTQASPVLDLKTVGSGTLNWMFWKIYDISLLTENGTYEAGAKPLALKITYARDITRDQLVSSTIDEWERQELSWQQEWSTKLDEIFPDIAAGDQLVLRVDEKNNSAFFFNEKPIGIIEDDAFTEAFLAIWLSSNTRSPRLTRELTGSL